MLRCQRQSAAAVARARLRLSRRSLPQVSIQSAAVRILAIRPTRAAWLPRRGAAAALRNLLSRSSCCDGSGLPEALWRRGQREPGGQMQQVGVMVVATPLVGRRPPGDFGSRCRRRRSVRRQPIAAAPADCGRHASDVGGWSRSSICRSILRSTSAPTSGSPCIARAASSSTRSVSRSPPKHARRQDACLAQFLAAAAEHQQIRRQISAIDRRNIARMQRGKRPRVVPIEEMPAIALQSRQRVKRALRALEQLRRRAVAEVVGGQVRQAAPCRCSSDWCAARRPDRDSAECCPAEANSPPR